MRSRRRYQHSADELRAREFGSGRYGVGGERCDRGDWNSLRPRPGSWSGLGACPGGDAALTSGYSL
ncbi:hypothetical protein TBK1r_54910 [Stieleria magnilauensis]|uniref:Uncharacterized protein n=1 Tax=Stieleria magnilauensis TaxID=2527963 RepID=A0ABX5XXN9_9BACT|nr:hypothetical protein TBK1r_54910 [Planctomycetes bacterium TBK1r]